jgi:hypothetical protein
MLKNNCHYNFILLLGLIFLSCENTNEIKPYNTDGGSQFKKIDADDAFFGLSGFDKNGYKYGNSNLVLDNGKEYPITWDIFQSEDDKSTISLPTSWILKHQENMFLFSEPDTTAKDFFIWKRYSKVNLNIETSDFVEYFYETITSDTIEISSKPRVKLYEFGSGQVGYYINCQMTKDSLSSHVYSFIIDDEKNIHELTIKIFTIKKIKLYKMIFEIIVDNIFINKQRLLGGGENVAKIREIYLGVK